MSFSPPMTEVTTHAAPTGWLLVARLANMAVGLAVIPLLIHYLGGEGFAAWAVLLALGAVFSLIECGMGLTFIKEAAPAIQLGELAGVGPILVEVSAIVVAAFLICAGPVFLAAPAIAHLVRIPDAPWLSAKQMLQFVYVAVAVRAILQLVAHTLNAARRFRALAVSTFAQSVCSNVAAAAVAVLTGRLDLTLITFWLAQMVILPFGWLLLPGVFSRFTLQLPKPNRLWHLWAHGLKVEIYGWTQIACYQFDKFLIAAFVGLWAVAPYEVATRSALALRSVPASGIDSFLSSASIGQTNGPALWSSYQRMTEIAAATVLIFMAAPLAVAPVFLYAWTGEMGYSARLVFLCLMLGAAFSVISLPAAAIAQAAGRADLQAKSAMVTLLVNLPLSWLLVWHWKMSGVAFGTAAALVSGSLMLLASVHTLYQQPLKGTAQLIARFWPALTVCVLWGIACYLVFEHWIVGQDPLTRYSRENRLVPGLLAGLAYVGCLLCMLLAQIKRRQLSSEQAALLCRLIPIKSLRDACARRLGHHLSAG